MTSSAAPPATPTISESVAKTKWIVGGVVLLIVCAAISIGLMRSSDNFPLSIHNPGQDGAMALAEVLSSRGTEISDIYNNGQAEALGANDLLVVTDLNVLSDKQILELMYAPTNVLFVGLQYQTNRFKPYVREFNGAERFETAKCDFGPARTAQTLKYTGNSLIPLKNPTYACFPADAHSYGFLQFTRPSGRTLSFLASDSVMTNRGITSEGNATFALNLLGKYQKVGWITGPTYSTDSRQSDSAKPDIMPVQFTNAIILLFAAIIVFAAAKGRRLGRVVNEDLPVVVHGAETVYGRARLYQRAKVFDASARSARRYAARQIGASLHIPAPASAAEMTNAISQYTGRNPQEVYALLYGEDPKTTQELLHLLKDLRKLMTDTQRKEP